MALKEARHLMETISEDFFQNVMKTTNYKYAGKLKEKNVEEKEIIWARRNASGGLLPVVADSANSPIGQQGDYREFKDQAIFFREAIAFDRPSLQKLMSNDKTLRIAEKAHIKFEVQNQMLKAMNTRELVAHSVIARAVLRYSSMGSGTAVKVDRTFPVKTRTVTTSWSDTANATIVTDMDTFLKEYELRVGARPDFVRMTSNMFHDYIKTNTEVKNIYTSSWQGSKTPANIKKGFLVPDEVAQANNWPPIELYTQRYQVDFTAKAAATAGTNVSIELKEGTWGLFAGGEVLIGFGYDADGNTKWTEKQTIDSVNHGKHIVVKTLDANVAAGARIVARPTFFPEDRILLGRNESETQYLLPPYGIEMRGNDVVLPSWRGLRADVFQSGESNLQIFRRVWDAYGMLISADNFETIKVIL